MGPNFLYSLVASLVSNAKRTVRRALPYLSPVINERKAKVKEHGLGEDWPGKPVSHAIESISLHIIVLSSTDRWSQNDLLQWIIEQAIPRGVDDESIAARILLVNFAAIHTSSMVCPGSISIYFRRLIAR